MEVEQKFGHKPHNLIIDNFVVASCKSEKDAGIQALTKASKDNPKQLTTFLLISSIPRCRFFCRQHVMPYLDSESLVNFSMSSTCKKKLFDALYEDVVVILQLNIIHISLTL